MESSEERPPVVVAPDEGARDAKHPTLLAIQHEAIELLRRFTTFILTLLLNTFSSFQDSLLSINSVRAALIWSKGHEIKPTILEQLQTFTATGRFDVGPYYVRGSMILQHVSHISHMQVHEDAQKLLLHATLHGMTWGTDRHCAGLPAIGRILLQAPGTKTSKYQEAVVRALAAQVGASLLVVDSIMLQTIARNALGWVPTALPPSETSQPGSNSGVLGLLLSLWLAGGRAALVWELIADALTGVRGPVILFVRDVEDAVCSSYEQYDAFVHVFGTRTRHPLRRGMVLIAGCSLADAGTAITDGGKSR